MAGNATRPDGVHDGDLPGGDIGWAARHARRRPQGPIGGAGGRVLPFDGEAAECYAGITARRRSIGRPISQFDAQIAALAYSHHASLATRNIRDFEHVGLDLINPWDFRA